MTFESSNKKYIEALPDIELIKNIRLAMEEGCIKPCYVFDQVDELIDRFCEYQDIKDVK